MFSGLASTVAMNVVPNADGWGPMPSLVPYGDALPGVCRGYVYTRSSVGAIDLFAGTAAGLYRFDPGARTWVSVTRTTGGPYTLAADDQWCFTAFGRYLIATNVNDEPQVLDVDTATAFKNLPGNPPKAKWCWIAGDYLVLGNLASFPDRVQWSGLNDVEFWTVGQKGSDYQTFPDGNEVQGGIPDKLGAFIIQRNAIRYMQFDPSTGYTFTFTAAHPNRGAVSPLSIVQIGPQDFVYLSEDGFFRGAQAQPIGAERVDEWFLGGELDLSALSVVQGVADPYAKIIWWRYLAVDGSRRLLGYHWQLDRWCTSNVAASYLVSVLTPGVTWDGLSALYSSIDAVDVPFDSRVFMGGRPTFAGFTTDNRLAYFSGAPLEATAETADIELAQGQRAFVNGLRVTTNAPTLNVSVAVSDYAGDDREWKAASSPSSVTGLIPARANGRFHRFRAVVPAGTPWTHLQGLDPIVKAGGRR
ncbi:MAG: hypothetical protein EOP20_03950 [Hyphomicrobiales bacterium]|nr:MAG: hypothetical protein EOP20_03950 [Hyphomicrobiales bacterium]